MSSPTKPTDSPFYRYKFLCVSEQMRDKRRQIIKLQALIRRHNAQKQLEVLKLDREAIIARRKDYAARKIQSFWKPLKEALKIRKEFLKMKSAAITIQRFYRPILEERWKVKIYAARMIQKTWRGHSQYEKYQTMRHSAVLIQANFRRYQCVKRFREQKMAVRRIEEEWRSVVLMREERKEYLMKKKSCVVIQAAWGGWLTRQLLTKLKSVIKIQSLARGRLARRTALDLRANRELVKLQITSAVQIQKVWRGYHARAGLSIQHQSAAIIQTFYKSYLQMKGCREEFLQLKQSSLVIQSYLRGQAVRRSVRKQQAAVVRIQACYKGWSEKRRYERLRASAVLIQGCYRGYLDMKGCRESFLRVREASVVIQRWYRGYAVRRDLQVQQRSVVMIQACYKGYRQRRRYKMMCDGVRLIQTHFRGYRLTKACRVEYLQLKSASLTIQRHYRGYTVRKDLQTKHTAATAIQAYYRMHQQLTRYRRTLDYIKLVQSSWRMYLIKKRSEEVSDETL